MTLVRGISRGHLVALSINCIVGAGILGLPSRAFALSGAYSLLAWLVCAVLVTGIGLCFAEVSSRYRESGGAYLYALRAFGPAVGFVTGWLTWLSRVLAFATVCSLFVDYAGGGAWRATLIIGTVSAMTAVLIVGIRHTAWASTVLTAAKLGLLAALVLAGLLAPGATQVSFGAPPAPGDFAATVTILLFAFFGFESAAASAGETEEPQRNMPFAILTSVALVTLLYMLVQYVAIVGVPGLAVSPRPLADLATGTLQRGRCGRHAGRPRDDARHDAGRAARRQPVPMAMGAAPVAARGLGSAPGLRTPVVAIAISAVAVTTASLLSTFAAAITITVATPFSATWSCAWRCPCSGARAPLRLRSGCRSEPESPRRRPW